jgi:hypothetical protein
MHESPSAQSVFPEQVCPAVFSAAHFPPAEAVQYAPGAQAGCVPNLKLIVVLPTLPSGFVCAHG